MFPDMFLRDRKERRRGGDLLGDGTPPRSLAVPAHPTMAPDEGGHGAAAA